MKNKKSGIIALIVTLVMVFNACTNPFFGNNDSAAFLDTPIWFFVDASGDFAERDTGRSVLVVDEKSNVVFYSDNIASSRFDRVGIAFEDKTFIFFFEKNRNFPTSMVLSDSEGSVYGFFTAYDPITESFGLTLVQGGDREIWSNINLSKDIFTHYVDDPELTPSQNLRRRNLLVASGIFISLNDFFDSNDTQHARNIFRRGWNFFTSPAGLYIRVAYNVIQMGVGIVTLNPILVAVGGYMLIIKMVNPRLCRGTHRV